MKLGRKFIGADINLGAVQTTTKRLLGIAKEIGEQLPDAEEPKYTGFTIYNVNNYDVFRNPVEARDLLVQALELQPLPGNSLYDGEKDEWFYKKWRFENCASGAQTRRKRRHDDTEVVQVRTRQAK